jgi:hypothetical protein
MVELVARATERKVLIGLKLKKRSAMIEALEEDLRTVLKSTTDLQEKLSIPDSKQ